MLMKVYLDLVKDEIYGRGIGAWEEDREILRKEIGIEEEKIQKYIYQPIADIYAGVHSIAEADELDRRAIRVVECFEDMYNTFVLK